MSTNEIHIRTSVICLEDDGFLRQTYLSGAEETLADAHATIQASKTLSGSQRYPYLADMRGMKSQERAVRAYYASPEVDQAFSALALLTGSRVSNIIANFFLTISKRKSPVKLFVDEAEAIRWLKGFVA